MLKIVTASAAMPLSMRSYVGRRKGKFSEFTNVFARKGYVVRRMRLAD